MQVQIYHAKNPNFGFEAIGPNPVWPDDFVHAATVDCGTDVVREALEHAFQQTNHIDWNWWDNPDVQYHFGSKRSTSVGDMVFIDGIGYRCDSDIWAKVTGDVVEKASS